MLAIQPQTNEHDDRSQRPDELHRRISFEEAHLLPVVSGSKNGQSQPYLGGDKNDARDNKRAMELLIDLNAKVADRGRKPPGFSQEEVNRDNRENHKEGGQGERYCSRALLSAFSPHLPPLRIQAGPPRITTINQRPLPSACAPIRALRPLPQKEKTHHIHPLWIFKLFSDTLLPPKRISRSIEVSSL